MKSPILGGSYVARSVNAADNRMVNLFPESVPEGGMESGWLQRAPGLRKLITVGSGPIRGMWQMGSYGFVVSGASLYSITKTGDVWSSTLIGAVTGTGPVSMSDNGLQLFIACDGPSFIYTIPTNTLAPISSPDFPGAVTVGFIDGYFVFNEPNSQRIWVTSAYEGNLVDPLDFASAEGSPDNIVAVAVDHREVWVFGTNSVEVWYNAGGVDFPLQRIQGAFTEIGCLAPYSVAKLDNGLFWLGADARGKGIVYRSQGYTGKRISNHGMEWQIQAYPDLSSAVGYTYQQDGHSFYVLNFAQSNTTWVYDVATDRWHERASFSDGNFSRHRANNQMSFFGDILVGDYQNGNVYAFDLEKYDDDGAEQKWLRSWRALPTGQNNLNRTIHHSLQLICEVGIGLDGIPSTGAQPQAMLRYSDNGGHTWSNEYWTSMGVPMGEIGKFNTRVIWRRLGATKGTRDRVYEVSGTDPVKIAIMGAELKLSSTDA